MPAVPSANADQMRLSETSMSSCRFSASLSHGIEALALSLGLKSNDITRAATALVASLYRMSDNIVQSQISVTGLADIKPSSLEADSALASIDVSGPRSFEDLSRAVALNAYSAQPNRAKQPTIDVLICHCADISLLEPSYDDRAVYTAWMSLLGACHCNMAICLSTRTDHQVFPLIVSRSSSSNGPDASQSAATLETIISSASSTTGSLIENIHCISRPDLVQLQAWNSSVALPDKDCLHVVIAKFVASAPASPAVCAPDGNFTYAQLDALSTRLASIMLQRGLQLGSHVPVLFEKSKYAIVAILAVLKAGGSCATLEPSLPAARLRDMVQQLDPPFVIVSPSLQHYLGSDVDSMVVDTDFLANGETSVLDLPSCSASQPAMIPFTSGSTGKPKGILHQHSSILTSLRALSHSLQLNESARIAQFAAFSFDLSMIEIFLPLIVGGCLCMPSEEDRTTNLTGCFNQMRVNFAMLTPSSIKLLSPNSVPTLAMIMVGGEPITGELADSWKDHVQLFNAWGTAECGICSYNLVQSEAVTSVGSCLGMGSWIVHPLNTNRLLPLGAIGELIVEGHQVAQGYLHELEKTAASFPLSTAWCQKPRGRLYRTGDLMRFLPNRKMEYCGRKDSQVKIRGCRIELGEVEYHMTADSVVFSSAVLVPKHCRLTGKLVAVLQLSNQGEQIAIDDDETDPIILAMAPDYGRFSSVVAKLTKRLQAKLPPQAIPEQYVIVDRVPLSKSDKVDRQRLSKWLEGPVFASLSAAGNLSTLVGENALTREVADLVTKTLALDHQSVNANTTLQHYGVNSLSAVLLSNAVKASFGVMLPSRAMFESALSVSRLADLISTAQAGPKVDNRDSIAKSEPCLAVADLKRLISDERGASTSSQKVQKKSPAGKVILLTGATGYVGSHLLHKLLSDPSVKRVIVLVRGANLVVAKSRLCESAHKGRFWREDLFDKLEIWLGDLSKPDLDLTPTQWAALSANGDSEEGHYLDAIVHSGAKVHWLATYDELREANVYSTVTLLNVAAQSTAKFIFVSSDPENVFDNKDADVATRISALNGYRQSKAVAEVLVRAHPSLQATDGHPSTAIIKPGYVIGSHTNAVINTDDFVWRLCRTVVRMGSYDSDDVGWIYIDSVDEIGERVLSSLFDRPGPSEQKPEQILGGILASRFWQIVSEVFKKELAPLKHDEWVKKLTEDVFAASIDHPMLPLIHLIQERKLRLTKTARPHPLDSNDPAASEAILRQCILELASLTGPHGPTSSPRKTSIEPFGRNTYHEKNGLA